MIITDKQRNIREKRSSSLEKSPMLLRLDRFLLTMIPKILLILLHHPPRQQVHSLPTHLVRSIRLYSIDTQITMVSHPNRGTGLHSRQLRAKGPRQVTVVISNHEKVVATRIYFAGQKRWG